MDSKFIPSLWSNFDAPRLRVSAAGETLTERYGRFSAQPFERGFGTIIGNSLRHALLSSIEGAAITAVKIEGVEHEFSTISGVVEDATDVILNLKQIPFKLHGAEAKTLTIHKEGAGAVTSADIEHDGDVEVLDPNVHIATVSEGGLLNIEMRLKRGRGYVPAELNFDEDLSLGYIPVNSVHTPVKKVNFTVEAARLGQNTEFDKLTIEVWTDGSVKPDDAVGLAAKLIKNHMQNFINFAEDTDELAYQNIEHPPLPINDVLDRSVDELEVSVRSYNCLKNANIRTIRDLVQSSEREMLQSKNFSKKSLNEIKDILHGMGFDFGMEFDEQGHPIPGTGGGDIDLSEYADDEEEYEEALKLHERSAPHEGTRGKAPEQSALDNEDRERARTVAKETLISGEADTELIDQLKRQGWWLEFDIDNYAELPWHRKLSQLSEYVELDLEILAQILNVEDEVVELLFKGDEASIHPNILARADELLSIMAFVLRLSGYEPEVMSYYWRKRDLFSESLSPPPWDRLGLVGYLTNNKEFGIQEALSWIRKH